jgi:hypothetical protein
MLLSLATLVQPTTAEGCAALHVSVAIAMVASAVVVVVFRPHRSPMNDVVTVVLNGLTALLSLTVGLRWQAVSIEGIFLAIVVIALVVIVVNLTMLCLEFARWRRVELQLREDARDGTSASFGVLHSTPDDSDTQTFDDEASADPVDELESCAELDNADHGRGDLAWKDNLSPAASPRNSDCPAAPEEDATEPSSRSPRLEVGGDDST